MTNDFTDLLLNWNINAADLTLLHDGADNRVYLVVSENKKYVLRQSKRPKNSQDIEFELGLAESLASQGIPVPKPFRTRENSLAVFGDGVCCLFTLCHGKKLITDKAHLPPCPLAFNAGKMLARFHNAARNFIYTSTPSRHMTSELERALSLRQEFVAHYDGGEEFIDEVQKILTASVVQKQPDGIIHNDFRAQNLLFEQDAVAAILDFDWSCPGNTLKDLGHALAEWSYPDGAGRHNPAVFKAFLDGYVSVVPDVNQSELAFWIRFSCLSDAATYFCDSLPDSAAKQPMLSYMYQKYRYFSLNK